MRGDHDQVQELVARDINLPRYSLEVISPIVSLAAAIACSSRDPAQ